MMRPAFSSTKQAAAFAVLLLVLLALPWVMGKNLPPREQAYSALSWGSGPYPWIRNQIFEETNDIDIAFVGSSHVLNGIDTPYVQEKLSEKLGRQAVVRTIAWGGSGFDGLYFIAQDLFQHRKIKLLVFNDEKVTLGDRIRNGALTSLFRVDEQSSILSGLPFKDHAVYYLLELMGMPRTLLSLVFPNLPAELFSNRAGYIQPENKGFVEAPKNLGAVYSYGGFSPDFFNPNHLSFKAIQPPVVDTSFAAVYSSPGGGTRFEFSHAPLPAWHAEFAKRFAAVASEHDCQLVILSIPVYDERHLDYVPERAFWPDLLSANVKMLGLPPAKLFGGINDERVQDFFVDPEHLNINGQQYFTRLITPALLKLYENSTNN